MPARISIPIIRLADRKHIGDLEIVRTNHVSFTHEDGSRRGSPKTVDQLLISITDLDGDTVVYIELPMEQLPADQS
jgi:hypothetical protein